MSEINKNGMLVDKTVTLKRYTHIEHGALKSVHAIVVHQTDTTTAQQTFNSYTVGGNGAHFLIDKSGKIYQTASLQKRCYHVGRLIKSKCLTINKKNCNSKEMSKIMALRWAKRIIAIDKNERQKNYPDRYPVNSDSVGIEVVGKFINDTKYEDLTAAQNVSLQWLISELYEHFNLNAANVYRHPEVSYKMASEGSTAVWK